MTYDPTNDMPISYMQRTRDYYLALGYANPYRWAHFEDVPFTPLARPLSETRLALITTAAPYQPGAGDQGPGAPHSAAGKFREVYSLPSDSDPVLRIAHLVYDRVHTSAEDQNAWLPLAQLRRAVQAGRIGALTTRFHGVPTNRSQRMTTQVDGPELLRRCREDGAEAALFVPI
jgi:hypothetical protein